MYNDFKIANYPYSLTTPEMFARHLSHLFGGSVIDGFTVAPGSGLQVVLAPGNALVCYGSGITATSRLVTLTNSFNLTVTAPDASNPRLDSVVLYVDTSINLPTVNASNPATAANVDGPGVAKAILVKGTAAATPIAPTASQIQTAIGSSSYPYVVLSTVQVDVGVLVIASNKISNLAARAIKLPSVNTGASSGNSGLISSDKYGNAALLKPFYADLNNGSGTRSSTNSSSWGPIAGRYSFTNPLSVPVNVQLVGATMIHMTDSSVISRISLSSTDSSSVTTLIGKNVYHQLGTTWARWQMHGEVTVPAGQTVTLGFSMRIEDSSGKYVEIANANTDVAAGFSPSIQGIPYVA